MFIYNESFYIIRFRNIGAYGKISIRKVTILQQDGLFLRKIRLVYFTLNKTEEKVHCSKLYVTHLKSGFSC
jgi:hypothetical protein